MKGSFSSALGAILVLQYSEVQIPIDRLRKTLYSNVNGVLLFRVLQILQYFRNLMALDAHTHVLPPLGLVSAREQLGWGRSNFDKIYTEPETS